MYPELLKIGPITIYSFGLMMGIAFLVASMLLSAEVKRRGKDATIGTSITMISLIGGIAGAKLFHLFENWSDFIGDPIGMAFSSGGLTWYGGFLLATALIYVFIRRKNITFFEMADMAAPSLAIGYGIARIGCHLAGDGDYGIATDLPWKTAYVHGTVPTAFVLDPATGARVPTEWVHPAPVYEFILGVIIFSILYARRKKKLPVGNQFAWFLLLHPFARLMVEFIRINPRLILGLSEAQLISIALLVWGVFLLGKKSMASSSKKKPPVGDARK